MPILWHIMKTYAHYGFNDFVLCLGYKGSVIKEYFYNYEFLANDFTIELGTKKVDVYHKHAEKGWKVTLADTGLDSLTGTRVKCIEKYIDGDTFMLTYGDGLTDINIDDLLKFHQSHGKIGTVSGVNPLSRYGELNIEGDRVLSFSEKPNKASSINGGYFVFNKDFFKYIKDDENITLEKEPLQALVADGELQVFSHEGFWQCMDTYRDYQYLENLYKQGNAPWLK